MEFENGLAYIARKRVGVREAIDWAAVRRNLPASATARHFLDVRPKIAARAVPSQNYCPQPQPQSQELTFEDYERLREIDNFFSFDTNTGYTSSSRTLVSSRGIAVNTRTAPSLEMRGLRAVSLLAPHDQQRLPASLQAKLPCLSAKKDRCFMHPKYTAQCPICSDRKTAYNNANRIDAFWKKQDEINGE